MRIHGPVFIGRASGLWLMFCLFNGKVILVSDISSGIESVNLLEINVHCGDPDLFAIPSIVPVQLIVNAWAEEMELVPGSFTHGAKVTSIE